MTLEQISDASQIQRIEKIEYTSRCTQIAGTSDDDQH